MEQGALSNGGSGLYRKLHGSNFAQASTILNEVFSGFHLSLKVYSRKSNFIG
jgi:hypothetical protein